MMGKTTGSYSTGVFHQAGRALANEVSPGSGQDGPRPRFRFRGSGTDQVKDTQSKTRLCLVCPFYVTKTEFAR